MAMAQNNDLGMAMAQNNELDDMEARLAALGNSPPRSKQQSAPVPVQKKASPPKKPSLPKPEFKSIIQA